MNKNRSIKPTQQKEGMVARAEVNAINKEMLRNRRSYKRDWVWLCAECWAPMGMTSEEYYGFGHHKAARAMSATSLSIDSEPDPEPCKCERFFCQFHTTFRSRRRQSWSSYRTSRLRKLKT